VEWRAAGLTLRDIVLRLADEGIPTVSGRSGWQISTIQRVLSRSFESPGLTARRSAG
jgi:hypothetical protein